MIFWGTPVFGNLLIGIRAGPGKNCQVKERLCHSTPSGGYGIARGPSSPVSMAGETVAAPWRVGNEALLWRQVGWNATVCIASPASNICDLTILMGIIFLVPEVILFEYLHMLNQSSQEMSCWSCGKKEMKCKQPCLPKSCLILKFMKQTFPISFQRGQFQLKKKKTAMIKAAWVCRITELIGRPAPPLSTYTATYSLKQARIEHRKQTYVPTFMFLFYLIPKVEATNVLASCRCFPSRSIPSRDCRGRVAICGYAELKL